MELHRLLHQQATFSRVAKTVQALQQLSLIHDLAQVFSDYAYACNV